MNVPAVVSLIRRRQLRPAIELASNIVRRCESKKNEGTYNKVRNTNHVNSFAIVSHLVWPRTVISTIATKTHRNDTVNHRLSKRLLSHLLQVGEHHGCNLLRTVDLLAFSARHLVRGKEREVDILYVMEIISRYECRDLSVAPVVMKWWKGFLCRQFDHKKLILLTFRLDALLHLALAVLSPSPFSRVAPYAFNTGFSLTWQHKPSTWSQTPPKPPHLLP